MEIMEINLSQKVAKNYNCKNCNYICSRKYDLEKHLLTRKHQMEINGNNGNVPISHHFSCDTCSRKYKTNSGLWKHMKKCKLVKKSQHDISSDTKKYNRYLVKEDVIEICKNTQHEFKEIILNMMKENKEFQKSFLDIIPQIGNNSHNTNSHNTTNNNQFNIQMFLNDHCKDAMNLTDFIQSLPITNETYDSTIENGLTKTITNMMVNGLNELDILERPIHCTDASRKTLYVKDSDKWEKDNELLYILKGIRQLSLKQRTLISKWKEANEGWKTDDNLQSRMTHLVCNSMSQIESDEKETGKIIRSISKNVYLDNKTKKGYV